MVVYWQKWNRTQIWKCGEEEAQMRQEQQNRTELNSADARRPEEDDEEEQSSLDAPDEKDGAGGHARLNIGLATLLGRLGTTQLVSLANHPGWRERVRRYLLAKEPSAYLTTLTTETTVEALKRVNGLLTAHSVKRGALLRGLQSGVSLEQLRILAKHKDLQMLLSYLPKADVAKALGMHEVTALL